MKNTSYKFYIIQFILFALVIIAGNTNAQTKTGVQKLSIANVHFQQKGDSVLIFYDILGSTPEQKFGIRVHCSTNGGQTYSEPLKSVTGDVGENISGGAGKKIVWDALKDVEKLQGKNIKFDVRAKVKNPEKKASDVKIENGAFTDPRDSITYKTVKIGSQEWLAENLISTRFLDGTPIQFVTNNDDWIILTTAACCVYKNYESNVAIYGRLYNWYAVTDTRGLCPSGWHVPGDEEWTVLINYLGGETIAGGKLKSPDGWYSSNGETGNSCNFSAMPGGARLPSGIFSNAGDYGYFWSVTEFDALKAWERYLNYKNASIGRFSNNKRYGFSVRCIRNQ